MTGPDDLDLILAEQLYATRLRLKYARLTLRVLKNDTVLIILEDLMFKKTCFLESMIQDKTLLKKKINKHNMKRNFNMLTYVLKHNRRFFKFFVFRANWMSRRMENE